MRTDPKQQKTNTLLVVIVPLLALVVLFTGITACVQANHAKSDYSRVQRQYQKMNTATSAHKNMEKQITDRQSTYVNNGKHATENLVTLLEKTDYLSHGGTFTQQVQDMNQRTKDVRSLFEKNGAGIEFSRFPCDQIVIGYGAVHGTKLPVFLSGGSPVRKVAHVVNKYGVTLSYDLITGKFSNQAAYQVVGSE